MEDFRTNGLLLPCCELAAMRLGLPMHRGPHRRYSELVAERVGQIEASWAVQRWRDTAAADAQARMRLDLLQRALRRYLLQNRQARPVLSRLDPIGAGGTFVELDDMADAIWGELTINSPTGSSMIVQAMPVRRSSSLRAA